jgi:hypothetical protein
LFCNPFKTEETERSGLFEVVFGLDRTRILALGRDVTVDQFDDRDVSAKGQDSGPVETEELEEAV